MITWIDNAQFTYEEFLANRKDGLGASEIAAIIFGSKYTSNLEIFYAKIGAPRKSVENLRTYLGKVTEDISEKLWSNYDGYTEQSFIKNIQAGTPAKKAINLNATAYNDRFPHLYATPDRQIQPYGFYANKTGYGSLEIKNTQSWILNSYETGLPTENVIQLCTQMLVTEWEYGELFYFLDNMRCQTHVIEWKDVKHVEQIILDHTIPFWDNVKKARPIYNAMYEAERTFNMRKVNECQKALLELEPPVQNTDGYRSFLTERFKDKMSGAGIVKGKPETLEVAKKHKQVCKQITELEKEERGLEIELKLAIGDNSVLDFGKDGKVSWTANKNGSRIFKNSIK